jgi:hypothetical protein
MIGCVHSTIPAEMQPCDQIRAVGDNTCTLWGPSLVSLLATPERCHLNPIRVIGFVRLEFEGDAIYLDENSYRRGIARNGFWVDVPDSLRPRDYPTQGYYIIEGRFRADRHGHLGAFAGTIDSIARFDPWLPVDGISGFAEVPKP